MSSELQIVTESACHAFCESWNVKLRELGELATEVWVIFKLDLPLVLRIVPFVSEKS
jgi:hypothetical protein